jgi:Ca2+-transporting ATPase
MNWYSKPIDEIIKHFDLNLETGLSDKQIADNLAKYGRNEMPKPKEKSQFLLFIEQFNNPIIFILIGAAILNGILAEPKDAIVIGFVVFLNTIIGFVQESRAADALKALQDMTAPTARVVRHGKHETINTTELTEGDVIVLESGDRVPADARLVETKNLLVNESMLTGESLRAEKNAKAIFNIDSSLGDRVNMVYSGTIIEKGRGLGIVSGIGSNSEFGKISKNVLETETADSPLQEKIEQFGKGLSIAILSIIAVIFVVGLLKDINWLQMLLASVGLAVSAIPEGLPVSVTITLSIGLYQMAKQNAVVKKLAAVETLGSTNVICTDKTGTLTKNQMTVTKFFVNGEDYEVTGSGYAIDGNVTFDDKVIKSNSNEAVRLFSLIGQYCTESKILKDGLDWKVTGDPTEAALMILNHKLLFNELNWNVNIDLPFESENQIMAATIRQNGKVLMIVKGGSERVLEKCNNIIDATGNIQTANKQDLEDVISRYSHEGLRVLGLAYKEIDDRHITLADLQDLNFVGFAGILDTVKDEVPGAVKECQNAGVRVVMITGDHIETATAIGKAIGLAPEKNVPTSIKGAELEKMSDEELFNRVNDIDVYARVAPEHKYRIVEQLQRHNNVVAMTGDGVNDAPALKKADIGIAMGIGSDVAKEASHIVLTDNNFTSIVNAVRRGRVILQNLQHILLYILATSFGGLLTVAVSVFLGLPLPVSAAQLLWINLVTDGTSTFPLAFEKEHGNVMLYPPRAKDEPLIPKSMRIRIILAGFMMMLGTIYVFTSNFSNPLNLETIDLMKTYEFKKAMTMAFCTLAFFQIWNVQNSRSEERSLFLDLPEKGKRIMKGIGLTTNPILLGVMLLSITLQVGAVALPFMNSLLNTVPLNAKEWAIVVGIPFGIIIFVESVKFITAQVQSKKA